MDDRSAIVELHHERPDGRGYPHGLRGEDIPLAARIVDVADAYDAMTSKRVYRAARPPSEALHELWRCAGTEFHAEIVGALATALPDAAREHRRPQAPEATGTIRPARQSCGRGAGERYSILEISLVTRGKCGVPARLMRQTARPNAAR